MYQMMLFPGHGTSTLHPSQRMDTCHNHLNLPKVLWKSSFRNPEISCPLWELRQDLLVLSQLHKPLDDHIFNCGMYEQQKEVIHQEEFDLR